MSEEGLYVIESAWFIKGPKLLKTILEDVRAMDKSLTSLNAIQPQRDYASEYEMWLYQVHGLLGDAYTMNQVDGALIRSQVRPAELYVHLAQGYESKLTRRFYAELA